MINHVYLYEIVPFVCIKQVLKTKPKQNKKTKTKQRTKKSPNQTKNKTEQNKNI